MKHKNNNFEVLKIFLLKDKKFSFDKTNFFLMSIVFIISYLIVLLSLDNITKEAVFLNFFFVMFEVFLVFIFFNIVFLILKCFERETKYLKFLFLSFFVFIFSFFAGTLVNFHLSFINTNIYINQIIILLVLIYFLICYIKTISFNLKVDRYKLGFGILMGVVILLLVLFIFSVFSQMNL